MTSLLEETRSTRNAWKRLAKDAACASAYARYPDHESLARSADVREAGMLDRELKLAEALRESREESRQLSLQLLAIQEWERQRIAADLHDGIGQSLSVVKLSLESMIRQLKTKDYPEATAYLQHCLPQVVAQLKGAMVELRRTAMDLRPSMLDDLGLIPTLSWFLREFEQACRDKKIEREISVAENDVPDVLKTAIFRILQEAVHNVIKHAQANCIRLSLKVSDRVLMLLVEDDGIGFDPANLSGCCAARRGFGMLTMRERATASGGTLTLKSAPGKGTWILVSWQLADAARKKRAPPARGGKC